jgi:hypothetical protein
MELIMEVHANINNIDMYIENFMQKSRVVVMLKQAQQGFAGKQEDLLLYLWIFTSLFLNFVT